MRQPQKVRKSCQLYISQGITIQDIERNKNNNNKIISNTKQTTQSESGLSICTEDSYKINKHKTITETL